MDNPFLRYMTVITGLALMVLFLPNSPAKADSASDTAKQIVETPISAAPSYAKYALVIGVTDYDSCAQLPDCQNDAKDFDQLLETKYGFTNVILMTDDPAGDTRLRPTQRHIQKALDNMYSGIIAGQSEVVFFFSGHGTLAPDATGTDSDWLVPEDGDPNHVPDSCINYDAIRQKLDTLRPKRVLLITDACRDLLGNKGVGSSGFGKGLREGDLGTEEVELQSCQPTETSLVGDPLDFKESVFTHFLIKGLSGDPDARDSSGTAVTFDSLKLYVQSSVHNYAAKMNETQTPDGHASLGSMVLAEFPPLPGPITPTPTNTAQQYYEKGHDLYKAGKYSDAEEPLREAVLLDPTNDSYQNDLGNDLYFQKKYADAEPFYREAVRLDPSDAVSQCNLGNDLYFQKKYPDAEPFYREALRLDSSNAKYQDSLGADLYYQGKYTDAETLNREAVRLDPSDADCQNDLGNDLYSQQKYADAVPFYREAIRLVPSNAVYQNDLGNDLYFQQKYADAEPFLREAVRLDSSKARYQNDLGNALFDQQKYSDAEPFYQEAVRLDPSVADYQNGLGNDLYSQQKYADAEPFYREAVRLVPSEAVYQNNLGDDLFWQQKYADAEPFHREAVRLDPSKARYQDDLGIDLGLQQKYADAEPFHREAVRLDPSNAKYQNNLGGALYFQQKYTDAETCFREAVRLDPNNQAYKSNLNNCLTKEGKSE